MRYCFCKAIVRSPCKGRISLVTSFPQQDGMRPATDAHSLQASSYTVKNPNIIRIYGGTLVVKERKYFFKKRFFAQSIWTVFWRLTDYAPNLFFARQRKPPVFLKRLEWSIKHINQNPTYSCLGPEIVHNFHNIFYGLPLKFTGASK
eukprot:5234566-Ditylum_brightwellii.AAC.1